MFGVEPVPTVGFGQGDVTIQLFLEDHGLLPVLTTETELYVIPVADYSKVMKKIAYLREEDVNVAVDMSDKKLAKKIQTAEKKGIRYLLVIGDDELESGRFKLKDLKTSTEKEMTIDRLITVVKSD